MRALRDLRAQVPFELGSVWLQTEAGTVPAAYVGCPFDLFEEIPFQMGAGLRSWILGTGRTVRIPSFHQKWHSRCTRSGTSGEEQDTMERR